MKPPLEMSAAQRLAEIERAQAEKRRALQVVRAANDRLRELKNLNQTR